MIYLTLSVAIHIPLSAQFTLLDEASALSDSCFQLTPDAMWTSGAIWNRDAVDLTTDFEINLEMYFGDEDANGADGMVLVFHTDTTTIGAQGAGIGAQGIVPSVMVEFDTWMNPFDPMYDHTAITINGDVDHASTNNLMGPVPVLPSIADVEDNSWHRVRIVWKYVSAGSQTLSVYFDGCIRLSRTYNYINNVFPGNGETYWGITSSTGGATNIHQVCVLSNSTSNDTINAVICPGEFYNLVDALVNTPGIYIDSLTNIHGCDSIVIINLMVLDTATVTNNVSICTGDSYPFNGQALTNSGTYSYTFSGANTCDTTFILNLLVADTLYEDQSIDICLGETFKLPDEVFVDSSGTYISAIISDFGCDSIVTTFLTVLPLPAVSASDDTICVDQLTTISVNTDPNNNVIWSNGQSGSIIEILISAPTELNVQVIDGNGCENFDTMQVATKGFSISAFTNDQEIRAGESAQLYAVGGNEQTQFQWEPSQNLSNPLIRKPIASPLETTNYTVFTEAENGCLAKDTITVFVTGQKSLEVPTGFSPNGDGMNDLFRPHLSGDLNILSMQVYNRWGKEVFNFPEMSSLPQWDGTFNNIDQPVSSYIYLIKAESIVTGEVFISNGNVTLLK